MFKKYLLLTLLIIFTFIIHQSFIQSFDWRLNFWPVILTFVIFVFNYRFALFLSVILGFLMDFFSLLPFGFNLLNLLLLTLLIYLLTNNFITTRSFLSLTILIFISTLFYNLFLFISQEMLIWLGDFHKILIFNLNTFFVQLLSNLILASLLFIITLKFTKRLRADVIIAKK